VGARKVACVEELAVEASMLKVYGSEAQARVVDEGVQLHGGYGFIEEYPVCGRDRGRDAGTGTVSSGVTVKHQPPADRPVDAELAQSKRMAALNRLVAGVAHEFHGPVGAIQSTNDMLRRWVEGLVPLFEGADHDALREYLRRSIALVRDGTAVVESAWPRTTAP
jgi:signal transduction histidine kinase